MYGHAKITLLIYILLGIFQTVQAQKQVVVNKTRAHWVVGSPQVGYWAVASYRHGKPVNYIKPDQFPDNCPDSAKQKFADWFKVKIDQVRKKTGGPYGFFRLSVIPSNGHLLASFGDGTLYEYRCHSFTAIKFPHKPIPRVIEFLGQTVDGALWFKHYTKNASRADPRRIPWNVSIIIYRVFKDKIQAVHLPQAIKDNPLNNSAKDKEPLTSSVICDVGRVPKLKGSSQRMLICIDENMKIRRYSPSISVTNNASGVYLLDKGLGVAFDVPFPHAEIDDDKVFLLLKYACWKKESSQCNIARTRIRRKREHSAYRNSIAAQTIVANQGTVYFISEKSVYSLDKSGINELFSFPKPVKKHSVSLDFSGSDGLLVTTPDFLYRIKR